MASSGNILVALAIFVVAFPSTSATKWIVGDSTGWTLGLNYASWTSGKTFVVGDTLVFNYAQGVHDVVIENNATNYQKCLIPAGATTLTSGADVVTLATAGQQWFICGLPGHCVSGMKLAITVSPATSATAPSPASSTAEAPSPASSAAVTPSSSEAGSPTPSSPAVVVLPSPAPPPSAATGIAFSMCHAWFVGVLSVLIMTIMA